MADWQVPILPRLSLSGEFYRGRGIGGLGGAIGTSIVYGGNPNGAFTPIRGVETAGGLSQLTFPITPKLGLPGVFPQNDAFTAKRRGFPPHQNKSRNNIRTKPRTPGNIFF